MQCDRTMCHRFTYRTKILSVVWQSDGRNWGRVGYAFLAVQLCLHLPLHLRTCTRIALLDSSDTSVSPPRRMSHLFSSVFIAWFRSRSDKNFWRTDLSLLSLLFLSILFRTGEYAVRSPDLYPKQFSDENPRAYGVVYGADIADIFFFTSIVLVIRFDFLDPFECIFVLVPDSCSHIGLRFYFFCLNIFCLNITTQIVFHAPC